MSEARDAARVALKALANEDLLYTHHGNVCAREEAYDRLAVFFEAYAERRTPRDPAKQEKRRT